MDNSKYKTKITIIIITGILLLSLVSFGYFYVSSNQSDKNRLAGGCFSTSFTDGESINLQNAFPQSFDEAKENKSYDFTITNTCNLPSKYYIILNVKDGSFNSDFIDYTLNTSNFEKLSNTLENTKFSIDEGYNKSFIIGTGLLNQNKSITHNLRIWIDESVSQNDLTSNSKFTAQIKVVNEVASMLGTDKIKNLVAGENSSSTDIITKEAPAGSTCTNTLAYDVTTDNNLRYVGANPCNYVSFNNELWRIIGVMNNVDDGTGKKETRLKIVRKDYLGEYSKDSSESEINNGYGTNDWTKSDLMEELNGDYLNTNLKQNTMWYNGPNNTKTAIFNHEKVINLESQLLINNSVYSLGPGVYEQYYAQSTPNSWYQYERNANYVALAFKIWTGKIGLINPSDYGFAFGYSENQNNNSCLSKPLYSIEYSTNCINSNWIFSHLNMWTITPYYHNNRDSMILTNTGNIRSEGSSTTAGYNPFYIYPTLYLKSNVSITSGDGSEENPFVLA